MFTVYVLENQNDKSWSIGQTDNLKCRLLQHNTGNGGRTTKIKQVLRHPRGIRQLAETEVTWVFEGEL